MSYIVSMGYDFNSLILAGLIVWLKSEAIRSNPWVDVKVYSFTEEQNALSSKAPLEVLPIVQSSNATGCTIIITDGLVFHWTCSPISEMDFLVWYLVSKLRPPWSQSLRQSRQWGHLSTYYVCSYLFLKLARTPIEYKIFISVFWLLALCRLLSYWLSVPRHPSFYTLFCKARLGLSTPHFSFVVAAS